MRRPFIPLLLSALLALPALAQTPAVPPAADAAAPGRNNQRVEHIRVEDAGSRVDELRAGGETRSITVTPNAPVPSYDVRPADATRPRGAEAGPGSAGPRTWKVLSF